ncbi:methyl-accepting chemotaxis protein [Methylobrevis albus]|uniref:MCP four helix bundle domain-containing protein n=1 Tax=Methylobrevis albus TaxID=2793297 RepID=A0A931I5A8_9HYPH|nr:methyl-accepting chemotaxis protein [Methylobrevis albus]MBH0239704.1 MCP four helix bundle domain-containing protein [Methylobrevis albus]
MKVQGKIFSVVAVLGVAVIVTGAIGLASMNSLNAQMDRLDSLDQQAYFAERLNGAITAVNASNRGITSARNAEESADYLNEIKKNLETLNQSVADWRGVVAAEDMPLFETMARDVGAYGALRLELAEFGAREGAAAGMARLKEPDVRANRQALQKSLSENIDKVRGALDPLRAEKAANYTTAFWTMLASAALALLVGVGIAIWIGTAKMARPMTRVASALKQMADGNLAVATEPKPGNDEIGDLWRTTERFRVALAEADQLKREQEATEAARAAQRRQLMHQVASDFERAVGGIVQGVSAAANQLEASARAMAHSAESTSGQLVTVASASEEASANVQTVASAAEELSASVGEIGRQVMESARIATSAEGSAQQTSSKVERLSVAATRIGDIVGLITTIAEQTNLLALNATIEAARAGEAGRGFAVVAQEVKNLATQTSKATNEIAGQVAEIQTSTTESATAIGAISAVIKDLNGIATAIAGAVRQQDAATQEIARNVQEASRGTGQVTESIETVSRAASDASAASGQVLSAARELSRQSDLLGSEVNKILSTIRAA